MKTQSLSEEVMRVAEANGIELTIEQAHEAWAVARSPTSCSRCSPDHSLALLSNSQ